VSFPDGVGKIKLPVNGRQKALSKLLGRGATIVMNVKLDDPETITQVTAREFQHILYILGLAAFHMTGNEGFSVAGDLRIGVGIFPRNNPLPLRIASREGPMDHPHTGGSRNAFLVRF